MSAIFGILRFGGGAMSSRDLERNLERMSNVLAHRGPDGRKFVADGVVGLGHCLMRVNREDLFEAQPLYDREADITLVADCRIDNREELAAMFGLGAADLRDMPDSALISRAYKKWGEDAAAHLFGDFTFAIWDGRAKKIVLARDHMGQRSLYYHRGEDFFVFASTMKALLSHPDVPRTISDHMIGGMLLHDRSKPEGETLFDDIRGLPGATVMTVAADGSARSRRYWEPQADPVHLDRDEAYYIAAYRGVLGEAVVCRIRRTLRPPGLVFSGGYDSAAIAGLAGPALAGRKLIAAASVMPADYRGTIRHARRWVDMCARDMPHLDVHHVTRAGEKMLSELDRRFIETGMPAGAYQFALADLYTTLGQAGAQVAMDGHGGDYTLNPRGQNALARFLVTFQLRRFATELRGHMHMSGRSLWSTLRTDIGPRLLPPKLAAWWRRLRRGARPVWADQPVNAAFAQRLLAEGVIEEKNLRIAARLDLDMREQMARTLRRIASGSGAGGFDDAALYGLELTRPFHDKRVVELALAIPQELYVKNGRNRYLACAALRDVYPREFQNRRRKNDDEIPDFQRMVKLMEPQLLADIARMEQSEKLSRYIDFRKIRRLLATRGLNDHNSGWEQETQLALSGILIARYLEWFWRDNR